MVSVAGDSFSEAQTVLTAKSPEEFGYAGRDAACHQRSK